MLIGGMINGRKWLPLCVGSILGCVSFFGIRLTREDRHTAGIAPKRISIKPDVVIGPRRRLVGARRPAYILIEFGDYQCLPCCEVFDEITALLVKHKDRLAFTFRNFPLRQVHSNSYEMAVFSEVVGNLVGRQKVQERLFELKGEWSPRIRNRIIAGFGIRDSDMDRRQSREARKVVDYDLAIAEMLELHGTPSLFLCDPHGHVFQLSSVSEAD
jgi:hypothetical protein